MYEFMRDHPEYMTSTNAEGVDRVENENYAFLMESTTIEYITERRCSLTQVGSLLDEKGYGIAMRKSKYEMKLKVWNNKNKLHIFLRDLPGDQRNDIQAYYIKTKQVNWSEFESNKN